MMIIANWKMYLTHDEQIAFCRNNYATLATIPPETLVLCPSFTALAPIATLLKDTAVSVGAQHCSAMAQGAFTGQVDAQSLAQIGCRYSLVGHSECRSYLGVNDTVVAQTIGQLLAVGITPIVCIGETADERDAGKTYNAIDRQMNMLDRQTWASCLVAYEPRWAIGSGATPTLEEIALISSYIHKKTGTRVLYGGSVTSANAHDLRAVGTIAGLLVGTASTDFQELKKIVS